MYCLCSHVIARCSTQEDEWFQPYIDCANEVLNIARVVEVRGAAEAYLTHSQLPQRCPEWSEIEPHARNLLTSLASLASTRSRGVRHAQIIFVVYGDAPDSYLAAYGELEYAKFTNGSVISQPAKRPSVAFGARRGLSPSKGLFDNTNTLLTLEQSHGDSFRCLSSMVHIPIICNSTLPVNLSRYLPSTR